MRSLSLSCDLWPDLLVEGGVFGKSSEALSLLLTYLQLALATRFREAEVPEQSAGHSLWGSTALSSGTWSSSGPTGAWLSSNGSAASFRIGIAEALPRLMKHCFKNQKRISMQLVRMRLSGLAVVFLAIVSHSVLLI